MLSWVDKVARWLVAHPNGHIIFRNASTPAADLTDLDLISMFLDGDTVARWVDAVVLRHNLFMNTSSAADDEEALLSTKKFKASSVIGYI